MLKSVFIYLLALFLFTGCASEDQSTTETIIIENAVTLDFSFGDDDSTLPAEFLIAKPRDIDVDSEGNIYVLDEDQVKVYNPDGTSLKLIGRPGQGPGEIEGAMKIKVSRNGYVSALHKQSSTLSIWDEKYNYLNNLTYDKEYASMLNVEYPENASMGMDNHRRLVNFSSSSDLIGIYGFSEQQERLGVQSMFLYRKENESVTLLGNYQYNNSYYIPGVFRSFYPNSGRVLWDIDNKNTVYYMHSEMDTFVENGQYFYKIFIQDENSVEPDSIVHKYTPFEEKFKLTEIFNGLNLPPAMKEMVDKAAEAYEAEFNGISDDHPNMPALEKIFTTNKYLYAVTNTMGEKFSRQTDVYDISTRSYVGSFILPEVETKYVLPSAIHNGKVYFIISSEESFPIVKVYNIDLT